MPDNNYRPEGDPLGGSTQVPGTDDMAAVTLAGVTIVDGDETFATIGDRLGFSAPAHFTRFFRDHCSVAPSEFRQVARLGR